MAVLEWCFASEFLEDAVEGLFGGEAAECDGRRNGIMICTVLRIRKDGLGVLNPVLCYELREAEIRTPVDTGGDVRAVRSHSRGEVLNSEVRVREELFFAQDSNDLIE